MKGRYVGKCNKCCWHKVDIWREIYSIHNSCTKTADTVKRTHNIDQREKWTSLITPLVSILERTGVERRITGKCRSCRESDRIRKADQARRAKSPGIDIDKKQRHSNKGMISREATFVNKDTSMQPYHYLSFSLYLPLSSSELSVYVNVIIMLNIPITQNKSTRTADANRASCRGQKWRHRMKDAWLANVSWEWCRT